MWLELGGRKKRVKEIKKGQCLKWDWGAFSAGCFCWSVVAAVCIADLVFHVIPYPGNVMAYVGVGGLAGMGFVSFWTVRNKYLDKRG